MSNDKNGNLKIRSLEPPVLIIPQITGPAAPKSLPPLEASIEILQSHVQNKNNSKDLLERLLLNNGEEMEYHHNQASQRLALLEVQIETIKSDEMVIFSILNERRKFIESLLQTITGTSSLDKIPSSFLPAGTVLLMPPAVKKAWFSR